MSRVSDTHIATVAKSVIAAERSNDRSIADLSRCMTSMIEQRTSSRTILDPDAIAAIRKVCRSIDLSLAAQAELADAHAILTALPTKLAADQFGPGCALLPEAQVLSIAAAA
ncbi:hypothetical protein SAMN05192583_1587 [Sphingomonas gellani]|uniref:Uncharacterized protein n=1 Tax=Sphingomonas gellani TaxID=1166340 RepID=A0A1H8CFA8_9SPHN|nr:hypothetical protein [Sphingomonas gellani]SEM93753.1 hypothetical protein SAMN05192583_1587 [Sphingomonas gellani]